MPVLSWKLSIPGARGSFGSGNILKAGTGGSVILKISQNQNWRFLDFWNFRNPELEFIIKVKELQNTGCHSPSPSANSNLSDFSIDPVLS
jgi:hypothetical protein